MIELKGITWDHPRGYNPMVAVSAKYSEKNPNIRITWNKRSLKDFGDFPVERLAEEYDLVIIDHPFMAESYAQQTLVNLVDYVSPEEIRARAEASVGASHESYVYRDSIQAFAVDAATMISAYRPDILQQSSQGVPKSLNDVFRLANDLPNNVWIYTTLCPTDIISLFISLNGQILGPNSYFDENTGFDLRTGDTVIDIIRKIQNISHPDSMYSNPIRVLDRMASENDIAYSPFVFGYSNYSRPDYCDHLVLGEDAPLLPNAKCSTMLGGAGIAVSMKSQKKKEAIEFLLYLSSTDVQKGVYFESGGQPADVHAWLSPRNNDASGYFLTNTLETLSKAFVRPKVPGWNEFQEAAGNVLNESLRGTVANRQITKKLNEMYIKLCASRR